MRCLACLALVLLLNTPCIHGYQFLRLQGLLPSFNDPGYAPDDVILEDDAPDPNGYVQNLGFQFDGWGYSTSSVKIFDTGYILLDASKSYEEFDSNNIFRSNYPYVAPMWVPSTLPGTVYHVAIRVVDTSKAYRIHDLDRITNERNRALDVYPTDGPCTHALVVTWKVGDLLGTYNKFQTVLSSGINTAGEKADYVMFLYESEPLTPRFAAYVNGNYLPDASSIKFAGLCSDSDNIPLWHTYSNYRCSDPGMYLFSMTSGTECIERENYCDQSFGRPNCMSPFHPPQDTCTESVFCLVDTTGSSVTFNITMNKYAYDGFSALDRSDYIGSGTPDTPIRAQKMISDCQKTLANPGSADSVDAYWFEININPVDDTPPCGIEVNLDEEKISYAFTIYDTARPEVDFDGKLVLLGDCYWSDLKRKISADIAFNGVETSPIVRSDRSVTMTWIDRPSPVNKIDVTSAKVGRNLYLLMCFDPGSPFVLNGDPFGIKPKDCYMSNNEDFNDWQTTGLGSEGDRAVQVFDDGCVSRDPGLSFYFNRRFMVSQEYNTKGGLWCLITGRIKTAVFSTADRKMWTRCNFDFCYLDSDVTCDDTCPARRKRSVSMNTTATGKETLTLQLNIEHDEQPNSPHPGDDVTASKTDDCVTMTTAISVIAVLIVIILIAFIAAVVIGVMLLKSAKRRRKWIK